MVEQSDIAQRGIPLKKSETGRSFFYTGSALRIF
jgi:hypothetical protein